MPPRPTSGEPGRADVEMALEAERAAADHWREVARRRSDELRSLQARVPVRAVLALERRVRPVLARVGHVAERGRTAVDRAALSVRALGAHPSLAEVAAGIRAMPGPIDDGRRTLLVVVGADGGPAGDSRESLEVVRVASPTEVGDTIRARLAAGDHERVAVALATSQPLEPSWLDHLVAPLGGEIVAATAMLVHPIRVRTRATPHDGLVRADGLAIDIDGSGVPIAVAMNAGAVPDPTRSPRDVDALSAGCLVVERRAYEAVGGFPALDDLDVGAIELSQRLRSAGGRLVSVPAAVVVDRRPVGSAAELRTPIDPSSAAWAGALARQGPALLRTCRPTAAGVLRFTITVAVPSAKVTRWWGDWHFAEGLAASLRRLGHEVRIQTIDRADDPRGRTGDVHVVLRGLEPVRATPGQCHVLWVISHPEAIEDEELHAADLVLVASAPFARHLVGRTSTPVSVLLQATDHRRFRPQPADPRFQHQIVVVAKTRDRVRGSVRDAIEAGLRPSIYGSGWREQVDPSLVIADHIDNDQVPAVYASAGVVLNDHWRTMRAWGFASNRLYDVLACGTPVISDHVEGLSELFDGAVVEYRDPAQLRERVDAVLNDPVAARARAERGRAAVLARHTFDHRAAELVDAIQVHLPVP